jgi:hypothetical protein
MVYGPLKYVPTGPSTSQYTGCHRRRVGATGKFIRWIAHVVGLRRVRSLIAIDRIATPLEYSK